MARLSRVRPASGPGRSIAPEGPARWLSTLLYAGTPFSQNFEQRVRRRSSQAAYRAVCLSLACYSTTDHDRISPSIDRDIALIREHIFQRIWIVDIEGTGIAARCQRCIVYLKMWRFSIPVELSNDFFERLLFEDDSPLGHLAAQ
jgi:hypothetical protein